MAMAMVRRGGPALTVVCVTYGSGAAVDGFVKESLRRGRLSRRGQAVRRSHEL